MEGAGFTRGPCNTMVPPTEAKAPLLAQRVLARAMPWPRKGNFVTTGRGYPVTLCSMVSDETDAAIYVYIYIYIYIYIFISMYILCSYM
jgi:hypothetical protein